MYYVIVVIICGSFGCGIGTNLNSQNTATIYGSQEACIVDGEKIADSLTKTTNEGVIDSFRIDCLATGPKPSAPAGEEGA